MDNVNFRLNSAAKIYFNKKSSDFFKSEHKAEVFTFDYWIFPYGSGMIGNTDNRCSHRRIFRFSSLSAKIQLLRLPKPRKRQSAIFPIYPYRTSFRRFDYTACLSAFLLRNTIKVTIKAITAIQMGIVQSQVPIV